MKNTMIKASIAVSAALGLVATGALSANAVGFSKHVIGPNTTMTALNTWHSFSPALDHDSVLTVTANFTDHTANSVKITNFRICYHSGPASAIAVNPQLRNAAGNFWGGNDGWWNLGKGDCQTWTPNKTYTKQADGEVVRVTTYLGGSVDVIAGFYR